MRAYSYLKYTFLLFMLVTVTGCKQNIRNNTETNNKSEIKKEEVVIVKKSEDKNSSKPLFTNEKCPCKMPILNDRLGFISYKNSLINDQKELAIKICDNGNNQYALSVESWNGFDEDEKPNRGKIYDYKRLDNLKNPYFESCQLNTNEKIYPIYSLAKIHSKWRIEKGKLIELDKTKDFPCIDHEEMEFE